MKKNIYLWLNALILTIAGLSSCSNDDDTWGSRDQYQPNQVELCKAWQLIGYGSEGNFHMIPEEYRQKSDIYGYRFYLIFNSDGTYTGRESINAIFGEYTCTGSQIEIGGLGTTYIYDAKGYDESEAFLSRLMSAKSYGIRDSQQLRIYYSDNEFLYFKSNQSDGHWECGTK